MPAKLGLLRRNPTRCQHRSGLIFGEAVHGTPLGRFRSPIGALRRRVSAKKNREARGCVSACRLRAPCTATLSSACARVAHPVSPTTAPTARAPEAADQP